MKIDFVCLYICVYTIFRKPLFQEEKGKKKMSSQKGKELRNHIPCLAF